MNTMAPMIYSRITARGRIEYYFLVFGGHSILVIEVNYKLGDADERLDAIAQVVAECDGMHYAFAISLFHTHMP